MTTGPHAESEADVLSRHDTKGVAGRLSVSIVTPRGAVKERQVDELTAPGVMGEFGVLPGHIPFLSVLKSGVLTIRDGQTRDVMAVSGGYVEVGAMNRVLVLAEQAVLAEDVDLDAARKELADLSQEQKAGGKVGGEYALLVQRLEWARARVEAGSRRG